MTTVTTTIVMTTITTTGIISNKMAITSEEELCNFLEQQNKTELK